MTTKEIIEKELKRLGLKKTDEHYIVGMIMLSALKVGANSDKIAKFLKLDKKTIKTLKTKYEPNLRKSKIWVGEKTSCDWFEENGVISFFCGLLVAEGLLYKVME